MMDRHAVCLPGFGRSFQVDDFSCGAQATFLILRYFGRARSVTNVARELGTTMNGFTRPTDIRRLVEGRGLSIHRLNHPTIWDIHAAIDNDCPAVLCSGDGAHWITAYGYSHGAVYVHDPFPSAQSLFCRWPTRKLTDYWARYALIIGVDTEFVRKTKWMGLSLKYREAGGTWKEGTKS